MKKYLKDLYRLETLIQSLGIIGALIGGVATIVTNLKGKGKKEKKERKRYYREDNNHTPNF